MISNQYKSLIGENAKTTWQFGPVDRLLQAKAEYDRQMVEQKILNKVVHEKDPFTGEDFVKKKTQ